MNITRAEEVSIQAVSPVFTPMSLPSSAGGRRFDRGAGFRSAAWPVAQPADGCAASLYGLPCCQDVSWSYNGRYTPLRVAIERAPAGPAARPDGAGCPGPGRWLVCRTHSG